MSEVRNHLLIESAHRQVGSEVYILQSLDCTRAMLVGVSIQLHSFAPIHSYF
jgi:hypothetical protein